MSGAAFGGKVRNQYLDFEAPQNVGHCIMALRPDLSIPASIFRQRIDELVARAKSSPRLDEAQEILMPCEQEARLETLQRVQGIQLAAEDMAVLCDEGQRVGLSPAFG